MKTCDLEGCTASENQLILCVRVGAGLVYACKEHILLLKGIWGDNLRIDEGVLKSYLRPQRLFCYYGAQEENKCEKEEKVKETEV